MRRAATAVRRAAEQTLLVRAECEWVRGAGVATGAARRAGQVALNNLQRLITG